MQRDGGPGGAGGAGNPTGGSFTGPALALEIIGDFIYGFSGSVAVSSTETNLLNHRTGNYYVVGNWFAHFNQASADPVATEDFRFVIYLNETQIAAIETSDSQGSSRNTVQDIIIPPYTILRISARNYEGNVTEPVGAVLTGRIYRG